MGRRARRDGGAVMGVVSGDAVRRYLACLFPGLIIAMTETYALLRRFDNTTAFRMFNALASAVAPGKTKRTVTTAAHFVAMTAATPQERAAAAAPQMWVNQQVSHYAQRQHRGCGRPSCEHPERFTCSVPLSHQQE